MRDVLHMSVVSAYVYQLMEIIDKKQNTTS